MDLPFSLEEFLAVFRAYNESVWPAQIVLVAVAVVSVLLAASRRRFSARVVLILLALLWIWMAVVYFWSHFATINPIAPQLAVMFGVQALLFLFVAIRSGGLSFSVRPDASGIVGGGLMLYALVLYPILGWMIGHHYPAAPTFGLPCPTVIFTLGLLLWLDRGAPVRLMVIPWLWAVVGTSAAIRLGMFEDLGLTLAAVVTIGLAIGRLVGTASHREGTEQGHGPEMTLDREPLLHKS